MDCIVISLNVCSLVHSSRVTMLLDFIRGTNASIYCLQETQTDNKIKIRIPGYNIYRGDVKRGWGGSALVIKNNIPIRNLITTVSGVHSTSIECNLSDGWHRFTSFYFPHLKLNRGIISDFFLKSPNTFFGGDSNGRHEAFGDASDNIYGKILFDLQNTTNIKIFNSNTPTCLRAGGGSFIDKFVSNSVNIPISNVETLDSFSDHFAISCTIPLVTPNTNTYHTKIRAFDGADIPGLNKFILRRLKQQVIPLNSNLTNANCEQLAANVNDIFTMAVDKYVPIKKTKNNRILLSPMVRSLQNESKRLSRYLFSLGKFPPRYLVGPIRTRLQLLRGMISNGVRSDSGKFFTNTFNSIENGRDCFRVIKQFTGHKKIENMPGALFMDSNKQTSISGDENMSNAIAKKFSENHNLTRNQKTNRAGIVNGDIAKINNHNSIISFNGAVSPDIETNRRLNEINLNLSVANRGFLTSVEEVADIIKTRPNKKSSGNDGMPFSLIKKLDTQIVRCLTIIFNHLIAISYFPNCWQHAIITPLPKPGKDSSLIENWRPISQLCCTSKIFEKIIANRINNHIHSLDIYKNQFGFLAGNSTYHALAKIQADVNCGLNHGKITTMVALDLKAAFDTIWHDGLLHKMVRLKFPLHIIKLIQKMLDSRSFAVKINDTRSAVHGMDAGVPQGSVLGPILFNLFTHDVPLHPVIKITQFADDTTIHLVHNDPAMAQRVLNIYLARLVGYFENWKLKLSEAKTELIHIMGQVRDSNPKLRKQTRNMNVMIKGHGLIAKKDIRLLGLQIQTNNRFNKHIELRLNKARKTRFCINRILRNSVIDPKIKCNMYKMYIRSVLMYASPVWCRQPQVSSHQMELLRRFERDCLRSAANIQRPRGCYKHISASEIYKASSCMRIDRFVAMAHTNFYGKCSGSRNQKFEGIMRGFGGQTYSHMPDLYEQHKNGALIINDRMTTFNTRYNGQPGLVYATGQ